MSRHAGHIGTSLEHARAMCWDQVGGDVMNDMSKAEAMRAAREARDIAGSSRGSSAAAIEAAMQRYLSAEQYHEIAEGAPRADEEQGQDKQTK